MAFKPHLRFLMATPGAKVTLTFDRGFLNWMHQVAMSSPYTVYGLSCLFCRLADPELNHDYFANDSVCLNR